MARKKKNHTNPDWMGEPVSRDSFVQMYKSMTTSAAYLSLSVQARSVYLVLRGEYNPNKGSSVICPYNEIAALSGVNRNNIRRAVEELEAYGFIDTSTNPTPSKVGKPANLYTFISKWRTITEEDAANIKHILRSKKVMQSMKKKRAKESKERFIAEALNPIDCKSQRDEYITHDIVTTC